MVVFPDLVIHNLYWLGIACLAVSIYGSAGIRTNPGNPKAKKLTLIFQLGGCALCLFDLILFGIILRPLLVQSDKYFEAIGSLVLPAVLLSIGFFVAKRSGVGASILVIAGLFFFIAGLHNRIFF